ncbi:hypothetical protein [Limisphaera sp. 4302-co]|uniref:hypothetical protein n=1 Tax=Limisphaera sp. 4302-co TaxID=3400417 RepID=UPI003C25DFF3
MQEAGQLVEERGEYGLYDCFLDAAFCPARGGGDGIGRTKAGKGVKIPIAVDARVLPIAVQSCSARLHESTLAQGVFDFMLTQQVPQQVVEDKACLSDALGWAFAARYGTDCIASEPSVCGESDAARPHGAAVSSMPGGGARGGLAATFSAAVHPGGETQPGV